jgi:hypothetical protein
MESPAHVSTRGEGHDRRWLVLFAPTVKFTTIGLDLVKHVFQVHGVREVAPTTQPNDRPCLFCVTAHFWARELHKLDTSKTRFDG